MLSQPKIPPAQAELEARLQVYMDKTAHNLAEDFVRLLNRANELGICLYPDDEGGGNYHVEYVVRSVQRRISIEWFDGTQRWAVVKGD